jgi:endogenous inhibitor of DNA gyrase (YacG/DUF329 family)
MNAKLIDLTVRRRTKNRGCPICGKPIQDKFRPFCSAHCRRVDLERWHKEAYRVPSEEAPDVEPVRREDEE